MYNNPSEVFYMEIVIIILLALTLVGIIVLSALLLTRKSKDNNGVDERLVEKTVENVMQKQMTEINKALGENNTKSAENLAKFQGNTQEFLTQRIEALNKQLDDKIAKLDKKVDEKLEKGFQGTSESMAQVRERLKAIDVAQKQMEGLGKEVVSLKNILEGNQTRGQYGEYQLSMVLHNVFGDTQGCYEEQYTMKKAKDGDDVRADAVVFMPEPNKMIAVDSKFPFQDYKRLFDADSQEEKDSYKKDFTAAVKKHITTIKDKYIIPGKTANDALMFIPNDGIFAFIHHELQDVVAYSREKRVILTSPSTLPSILFTINLARVNYERSKRVEQIGKDINMLGKQFELFGKEWDQFSHQLETATRTREKLDTRVTRINDRFEAISSAESNDDVKEIELSGENQ